MMSPTKPRSIFAPVASMRGGAFSATSTSLPESTSALPPSSCDLGRQRRTDHLGQHAVDDPDRGLVGDAQAVDKLGRQIFLPHGRGDRLAAAVDDDGIDPHRLEKNDVAHDALDQVGIFHRRAAILDHDGASAKLLEIGQRLEQRIRLGVSSSFALVDPDVLFGEVGREDTVLAHAGVEMNGDGEFRLARRACAA